MTPQDIIAKLFLPVDGVRLEKAKGLALRHRIEWAKVLAAMTPEQRQQVGE